MTTLPRLDNNNLSYVLETAGAIADETGSIRAGSKNEEQAGRLFLNELINYCDETSEQSFNSHPGVGTLLQKILCVFLIISTLCFFVSVSGGYVLPSAISLVLNLIVTAVFTYKFLLGGTSLDALMPRKKSINVMGKRFSRSDTEGRVVLVTSLDAPKSLRKFAFGNGLIYILRIFGIIGNTLLFFSQVGFLFAGAPLNSKLFEMLCGIAFIFIPFYIISLMLMSPRKTATGVSSSLIPSSIVLGILKQFSEDSFRYDKTEICVLMTGSHYSGNAGAVAFAKKYKRLFSDVPTIFIPIEELASSDKLSLFFKDGSGVKGSGDVASVIANAAQNLDLKISKETLLLSTGAFNPFSANDFSACSFGTSKKYISKCFSSKTDTVSNVKRKTIEDISSLIIETLNYYDN